MISAPMPGPCRSAIASSTPSVPPGSPRTSRRANRVANSHSWSRCPAWPNGVSRACPSPVANPSSEIETLWMRTRDMAAPSGGGGRSDRLTCPATRSHRPWDSGDLEVVSELLHRLQTELDSAEADGSISQVDGWVELPERQHRLSVGLLIEGQRHSEARWIIVGVG